jgi:Na+/H+ antiporter NhaA
VVILAVGIRVAGGAGTLTTRVASRANVDKRAANTPLAALFEGRPRFGVVIGQLVKGYVVLVSLLLAASYAGLAELTTWLNQLIGYVPQLLGGLLLIVAGIIVSDYAVTVVKRSTSGKTAALLPGILKGVLYFVVVVMGLDTAGIDVTIVYMLGESLSLAIGIGLALAIGLSLGLGSKEYVAEHVDEWSSETRPTSGD